MGNYSPVLGAGGTGGTLAAGAGALGRGVSSKLRPLGAGAAAGAGALGAGGVTGAAGAGLAAGVGAGELGAGALESSWFIR